MAFQSPLVVVRVNFSDINLVQIVQALCLVLTFLQSIQTFEESQISSNAKNEKRQFKIDSKLSPRIDILNQYII